MRLAGVILLCCLAMRSALADETNLTLTVDGHTYSNIVFGLVTPVSVSVRHSTGASSIPLEKLPPDLQKRFGYDPQKAAAYRQEEAKQLELSRQQDARRDLSFASVGDVFQPHLSHHFEIVPLRST
jgi:hypothetical protein